MKYVFFLIILIVFLGGCMTLTDSSDNDGTTTNGGTTNGGTYGGGTSTNGISISYSAPLISTSIRPSNPDRGETFTITVTADHPVGVSSISWGSPDSFLVLPDIGSYDCGQQKICIVNWEFSSGQDGLKTITVYATDSAGQESRRSSLEINVRAFDFIPPKAYVCGNNDCEVSKGETDSNCPGDCVALPFNCGDDICEAGESYLNCSQDCFPSDTVAANCGNSACEVGESSETCSNDCSKLEPDCGNGTCEAWESATSCPADCQEEVVVIDEDECSGNSDCGYKEVCKSGTCKDVQCTNSGQCSGCKRCSSNRCVSCGSGPYGCYC